MENIIKNNKEWIDSTWSKLDKKLSRVAITSRNKIPYTTIDGKHDNRFQSNSGWWTNGFWGGLMWLMYAGTGNEEYKITAETSEKMMDKVFETFHVLHHDVGFMWHILSGANYRLTGNIESKNRNLIAAATLASRFHPVGGFIQAWNTAEENREADGWSIIDCMLNIPLLYWASEVSYTERFKQIAMAHADMAMRDHVRADGSVNHIVSHDVTTGEMIQSLAGQGYAADSSWSRGVAWALYGFVLSYIHTGKKDYLDTAKKVAHYFITCVSDTDYVPVCDFRSPTEPVKIDSTAGACAACGLIELAKAVPEYEKSIYLNAAIKILKALEKKCCNWDGNEDAVLMLGTEAYFRDYGNHIPIIYGDFFFTEAILKLKGNDFLPW